MEIRLHLRGGGDNTTLLLGEDQSSQVRHIVHHLIYPFRPVPPSIKPDYDQIISFSEELIIVNCENVICLKIIFICLASLNLSNAEATFVQSTRIQFFLNHSNPVMLVFIG